MIIAALTHAIETGKPRERRRALTWIPKVVDGVLEQLDRTIASVERVQERLRDLPWEDELEKHPGVAK